METQEIVRLVLEFIKETGNAMVASGFPIAVKYVIAQGISNVATGGIGGFLLVWGISAIVKMAKNADKNDDNFPGNNTDATKLIFHIITGVVGGVVFMFNFFDGIRMLISPEWYVILNIVDLVK